MPSPKPQTPDPTRTARTPLQNRDHEVVWHPCSQMHDYEAFPPLEVVRAAGPLIELADGRKLYDAISSWWCKSLGHAHPALVAAVREQTDKFEHVITANTTSEALVSLCERLLEAANSGRFTAAGAGYGVQGSGEEGLAEPCTPYPEPHFTKCFFADNGSTGVEVAIKMALQAQHQRGETQRTQLATLSNGYHGETAAAMSVSDLDLYTSPHGSIMFETLKLEPVPWRSGPDDPEWMNAQPEWDTIEALLNAAADTLAAVIYEPVLQAAGGMRPYSPDLLRRLRGWADANGVYLIADEIAAGLGRCGAVLASQLAMADGGWRMADGQDQTKTETGRSSHPPSAIPHPPSSAWPDFAVVSKGLTAGFMPMSVVLTTEPVYGLFYGPYFDGRAFMHSNTYAGNALAVAVAHAALDVYAETDILSHVARLGPTLRAKLQALSNRRGDMRNVRGVGMAAAVDLTNPDGTALPAQDRTGYRVYRAAVESRAADGCGALLRPLGDSMYLFPPLNSTAEDIDAMVTVLEDAVGRVMDE